MFRDLAKFCGVCYFQDVCKLVSKFNSATVLNNIQHVTVRHIHFSSITFQYKGGGGIKYEIIIAFQNEILIIC
jgi:hypothetical protein